MLYSLEAVRDNIRNREGKRVFYLGRGDQLTSSARDYLNQQRIAILPGEQAKPERYALLTGGYLDQKPEHMTHLNAQFLVPKNHPRIQFRGELDLLEAELVLCQLKLPECCHKLGEILALAREIMACDVLEKPLEETALCGLTQEQLRRRSHFPQEYYGQPHFMPQHTDGEAIAHLNRLRAMVRRTELAAVNAFLDTGGNLIREDLIRSLNRMSSMLYIMMIERKGESYAVKNDPFGQNI